MTDSPSSFSSLRDRAASTAGSAVERARPMLARAWQAVALFAWRVWITVGPALRSAGRAVMAAVQAVEERLVPALVAAARAVPRGLQRAEQRVVPALLDLAHGTRGGLDRAERRFVPALAFAGTRTAGAVARGGETVSGALTSSGRGLAGGLQRVEAFALPVLSPRVAGPSGDGRGPDDWEGAGMLRYDDEVEGDYVPPPVLLRVPEPEREVWRGRLRAALVSVVGMLATAGIVVLAVAVTARETVGTALADGTDAVGVNFRLPDEVGLKQLTERSYIYAANGQELDVLDQEENRRLVDLAEIPLVVQQAVITAEDRRFYEHEGYDVEGIGRAVMANIEAGDITQGGSTITQQLAKSAVGADRTLGRKFEELAYAVALEERFSKDELLGQYLNQVYFGELAYGVAAAAEEYFGVTDVTTLTVEQGALLAAMIREPGNANPRTDPETALRRRDAVLEAMVTEGYLDRAAADAAKALPITVVPDTPRTRPYDFIADSVIREFKYSPEFAQFGATPEEREEYLYVGGLRIYSSLDPALQEIAKSVIAQNFPSDPTRPTGAIVSVQPQTGRILAAHSGLDYGVEQLAIPTQARRQPGSAAKPFVYAQALRMGVPPSIPLSGRSPAYFDVQDWRREDGGVTNYGGSSYGTLDMPRALRNSVNTATVQLSQAIGIDNVIGLMGEMGINTGAALEGEHNPSIALGGLERGVTPLEMAGAYATFANAGVFVKPHFIDRVEDRNGNRIYEAQIPGVQVLDPVINAQMVEMMRGVVTGGTGTRAAVPGWEVAGKTGTTQEAKDAWFVGYTPTLATAIWMGVANPPTPLRTTGGGVPAQVWRQFMTQALQGQPPVPFPDVEIPEGRLAAGQPTTVPDVEGMSQSQALEALSAAKLFGQIRAVPSNSRSGTVLRQDPDGGEQATTGDSVTISVSTGEAPRPTPTPTPTPRPTPQPTLPPQPVQPILPTPDGNGNGNGQGQGRGVQLPGPPEPPEPD